MSHPIFDVTGRTALVTGSTRGIGRALAAGLLEAGCTVVVNGRDPDATAETARELSAETGGKALPRAFDVTDRAAVDRAVASVEDEVGAIDVLVNNAGIQHRAPFVEYPDEMWDLIVRTNLTSAFLVGRAVASRMVVRGHGKIVNICSLLSEVARPGTSPYAATKGGLKMLTKGMCADLGPSGVQVNGVAPGYLVTDLNAELLANAEFDAWVRRRTPAGRWGETRDLVGAVLFLCSPASDFVNGQLLSVDGGMLSVL